MNIPAMIQKHYFSLNLTSTFGLKLEDQCLGLYLGLK